MIEPHWHKWLSGDEWAKMGPFPDEQACPYCRTEKAEARVKELESFIVVLWYEFGIGGDIDGGWLQDEMEKRGLIVPHVVTEDEYDEESESGPGDTIYRLSPAFERALRGKE